MDGGGEPQAVRAAVLVEPGDGGRIVARRQEQQRVMAAGRDRGRSRRVVGDRRDGRQAGQPQRVRQRADRGRRPEDQHPQPRVGGGAPLRAGGGLVRQQAVAVDESKDAEHHGAPGRVEAADQLSHRAGAVQERSEPVQPVGDAGGGDQVGALAGAHVDGAAAARGQEGVGAQEGRGVVGDHGVLGRGGVGTVGWSRWQAGVPLPRSWPSRAASSVVRSGAYGRGRRDPGAYGRGSYGRGARPARRRRPRCRRRSGARRRVRRARRPGRSAGR